MAHTAKHITPTTTLTAAVAKMDDREKLMLIDWLTDQLADEVTDELAEGLAAAFERAEIGYRGVFTPFYPGCAVNPATWSNWRVQRDAMLSRRGLI